MKSPDIAALGAALKKNKYLLAALCLGLVLLLLPRRSESAAVIASPAETAAAGDPMAASGIPLDTESRRLAGLLENIRGVGAAEVLLSARGCIVVCEGADSSEVRLSVTGAVAAYTGLGSDKIQVYPMRYVTPAGGRG